MKTTIKNLIALSLTVATTICTATITKANDGNGKPLTVLTEVKKVNKINVSGNVEVLIIQSATESVNVYDNYYSKNALIQQKNDVLRISSFEKLPLTVVVYVTNLQEITVSGNAKVKTSGAFNTLYLDVYLNDNATATLNIATVSLFTKLTGKASLNLSGTSNDFAAVLASAGCVTMDGFAAESSNIQSKNIPLPAFDQAITSLPSNADLIAL